MEGGWALDKETGVLPRFGCPMWVLGCRWQKLQLCFSGALHGLECVDGLWGGQQAAPLPFPLPQTCPVQGQPGSRVRLGHIPSAPPPPLICPLLKGNITPPSPPAAAGTDRGSPSSCSCTIPIYY